MVKQLFVGLPKSPKRRGRGRSHGVLLMHIIFVSREREPSEIKSSGGKQVRGLSLERFHFELKTSVTKCC